MSFAFGSERVLREVAPLHARAPRGCVTCHVRQRGGRCRVPRENVLRSIESQSELLQVIELEAVAGRCKRACARQPGARVGVIAVAAREIS